MAMTFAEIVAIGRDDQYGVSPGGTELLFDLFEHLYKGGNLYNFEGWAGEYMTVLLATTWNDINRLAMERANAHED